MKKFHKVIIVTLCLPIALLLAITGAYLWVSDATLIPLLSGYLETSSGARVTISSDAIITRTLSPILTADELIIEDQDEGFSAHISELQLQFALPALLAGKLEIPLLYILGDSRIEMRQSGDSGTTEIPQSLPLVPIFHDIKIAKLSIAHQGQDGEFSTTQLNDLSVSLGPENDKFIIRSDIELSGNQVAINAVLPRIDEALKTRQLPFAIEAKSSENSLSADGNIDFKQTPAQVQARASVQTTALRRIATGIQGFSIPGELSGQAEIAGTFEQLSVDSFSATWQGPDQSTATVNGNIEDVMQMSGCEFNIDSRLTSGDWLAPVLPESMGSLQNADFSARISCADQHVKIEDFDLQVQTEDQLNLSLTGQLELVHPKPGGVIPQNIDLELQFSAPTTRTARLLFFESIWEFGPISGVAQVRSTTADPSIEEISIRAKDPQGIEVKLTGRIAQFPLSSERSNTGYDLDVSMQSAAAATILDRFGLDLPLPGPLLVNYRIEGDSQPLQLNQISFKSGNREDINISSTGYVHFGDWDLEDPVTDVNLAVQATSNNTRALEKFFGQTLPELGPITASALIHTVSGKDRIDDFLLQSTDKSLLDFSVQGSAEQSDFFIEPGIFGMQLQVELSAENTDHSSFYRRHC